MAGGDSEGWPEHLDITLTKEQGKCRNATRQREGNFEFLGWPIVGRKINREITRRQGLVWKACWIPEESSTG